MKLRVPELSNLFLNSNPEVNRNSRTVQCTVGDCTVYSRIPLRFRYLAAVVGWTFLSVRAAGGLLQCGRTRMSILRFSIDRWANLSGIRLYSHERKKCPQNRTEECSAGSPHPAAGFGNCSAAGAETLFYFLRRLLFRCERKKSFNTDLSPLWGVRNICNSIGYSPGFNRVQ